MACVLAAIAIPQVLAPIDRARGLSAARYLAARMALARAQAVSRSATIALRFEPSARGITFSLYQDGNGNGVLTQDIQAQTDRIVDGPVLLADMFPGAEIGLLPGVPATEPVQLGGGSLMSFTPFGTASSGSVYIRGKDGTQWMVRVLGVTARVRLLRYATASGQWVAAP
jgi:type II secretory pathway pseudopilin PulG